MMAKLERIDTDNQDHLFPHTSYFKNKMVLLFQCLH